MLLWRSTHGRWRIASMDFSPFKRAPSSLYQVSEPIQDAYRVHAFQRLRIGFA
jgi:hypothetical protein